MSRAAMSARSTSRKRPTRAELVPLIREARGNMTHLAGRLGTTRQTLYTWIYQLDLADLVGIRTKDQQDEDCVREGTAAAPTEKSLPSPERPPGGRISVTARMDSALWRALRIRGIHEGRAASDVLEDAVGTYLALPNLRS